MSELKTNVIGCSSGGGQNSDSPFLVPVRNFANNIAAIANYPKIFVFFPIEMSSRYEKLCYLVVI